MPAVIDHVDSIRPYVPTPLGQFRGVQTEREKQIKPRVPDWGRVFENELPRATSKPSRSAWSTPERTFASQGWEVTLIAAVAGERVKAGAINAWAINAWCWRTSCFASYVRHF